MEDTLSPWGGGGGVTPYNGLHMGRLYPKGVPFSEMEVYIERLGI